MPELTPSDLTLVGVLVTIITAGLAKKWVFGWQYDKAVADGDKAVLESKAREAEMRDDRNFWRDSTLQLLNLNEKAVDVAAKRNAR